VEDESWGAAGAIGASSHGLKVIAAVKPATPRQAAESKDRFKGRDRTVCGSCGVLLEAAQAAVSVVCA
jgi:hypothetical protein